MTAEREFFATLTEWEQGEVMAEAREMAGFHNSQGGKGRYRPDDFLTAAMRDLNYLNREAERLGWPAEHTWLSLPPGWPKPKSETA